MRRKPLTSSFTVVAPLPSTPFPFKTKGADVINEIVGLKNREYEGKKVRREDLWIVRAQAREFEITTDELLSDPYASELLDNFFATHGCTYSDPPATPSTGSDDDAAISSALTGRKRPRNQATRDRIRNHVVISESEDGLSLLTAATLEAEETEDESAGRRTKSRLKLRSYKESSDREEGWDEYHTDDSIEDEESSEEETSDYEDDEEFKRIKKRTKPSRRSNRQATVNAKHFDYGEGTLDLEERRPETGGKKGKKDGPILRKSGGGLKEGGERLRDGESVGLASKHVDTCDRCDGEVASILLKRYMKKKRARRTRAKNKLERRYGSRSSRPRGTSSMSEDAEEDDDVSEEEINIRNLGAWVTCKTCCIATHWGCLPQDLKKETKKEFGKDVMDTDHWVTIDECRYCRKDGGMCKVCKQPGVRHEVDIDGDVAMNDAKPGNVLFRCDKCLRPAHYRCLPLDPEKHHGDRIAYYQHNWLCDDCEQFSTKTDYILAWRYSDPHDPRNTKGWVRPNAKEDADVEYLVKFEEESFREVRWVPHAVMKAVHQGKLRHFLKDGSKISYHGHAWDDIPEDGEEVESDGKAGSPEEGVASLPPDPNAESKIPLLWKTIDRILDVRLRKTPDVGGEGTSVEATKNVSNDPAETWDRITSVYVKWCDLDYSQCSWYSSIPQEGDKDYEVFKCAYERYLASRDVKIPQITQNQIDKLNKARSEDTFTQSAFTAQPQRLKGGKLMDFQLDGVNWMYHQWWTGKSGILADEMGLGKTIQVISFISILKNQENRQPFLVIVPNSTISNWIREFEKWAPDIRVVPYFGLEKSRRRIEQYELFPGSSNTRTLRAHVVVATYEAFVQNTKVFKKVQRWETLIVDEGQRLKAGDTSQATRELAQLPVGRRYLMTGTPVNNNVGELLNLLHFLDPDHWDDVEHLSKEYENLDQARIEKLRESLRPYLLRRTKETVLDLPPCTEIIIPMSISPLQKEIYKSLLSKNAALMEALTMKTNKSKSKVSKSSLNNLLMQLRKCLGHPYLVSPDIEPTNLSPEQEHLSLVEASSKLTLLHRLLPKLKQRGHRVLLFTQFKIVLDILETFMTGERITYLRLDGNTPQETRQKGIDLFNKPNSPIDVYMLSTRAGGVGINLTTADTVIIFDSDWNPHQDLQAIARAHRIGQKKPVKVFRLMIKNTCEEKIMQAGKRKLVLDHLIVQRINAVDDTADDVESILQFGAKALFEDKEGGEEVIQYSDEDIERLLDRSDAEAKSPRKSVANSSFAFARVWELKKDSLNDMEESTSAQDDIEATRGFWNNILKEQEEAQRKAETEAVLAGGKGKRKRTQRFGPNPRFEDNSDPESPDRKKKRKNKEKEKRDDEEFLMRDSSSSSSSENAGSGEAGTMDDGDVELMKSLEQKSQKYKDKKQRKAFKELRRRGMEERVLLEGSGAATPTDEPQGHRRVVSIEQMQKQCDMIATLARTQNISDAKVNNYLEQAANTIDEAEQLKYMKKAMKRLIALTPQGLDTGSSIGRPPSSPPRKGPKTSKQLRPAAKSAPLASAQQRRLLAHKTSLADHNSTSTSSSAKASKYYAGNSTSSPKHKVAAASLSDLPLVSTTSASHAQLSKAIKAAGNSSSGSPSDDSVVVLKKLALSSQRIPDGSASGQPQSREASSGTSSTGKRPTFSGPLDSFFSMAKKQKT